MDSKAIGWGMTSEIYPWGDNKVLKLFKESFPAVASEYEAKIASIIGKTGIEAPAYRESLVVEGRRGIVYDLVPGEALIELTKREPLRAKSQARAMARAHLTIHQVSSSELPTQNERLTYAIEEGRGLLGPACDAILARLYSLPDKARVCHGDYHPGNILVSEGRFVAIDWMNAYSGDPASDVARTYLMFVSPYLPDGMPSLIRFFSGWIKRAMGRAYLREYMRLSGAKREDIDAWVEVMLAARIHENIPLEREWILGRLGKETKRRGL